MKEFTEVTKGNVSSEDLSRAKLVALLLELHSSLHEHEHYSLHI